MYFSIRVLLARENERRDAEPRDNSYDDVYVARIDEEGNRVEVKVSKVGILPHWEAKPACRLIDVVVQTGVFGFDGSSKSRLQICFVKFAIEKS